MKITKCPDCYGFEGLVDVCGKCQGKGMVYILIKAELDEAVKAAIAYRDLTVCYRIGRKPTEKLFKQLEKANKYLKEFENG